jgi:thiol:disulfide interchange protein
MKRILAFSIFVFISLVITGQVVKPVTWSFSTRDIDNDHVDLVFRATISSHWHMYGLNIASGGPVPIRIGFEQTRGFVVTGKPVQSPKPFVVMDEIFGMKVELHSGNVTITQRINKIQTDSITINGTVSYQTCSDMQCVLSEDDFSFRLKGAGKAPAVPTENQHVNDTSASSGIQPPAVANSTLKQEKTAVKADLQKPAAESKSLWGVFFFSLLLGLGGLVTPCVYPMIPLTVSYFLRGNKTRSRAVSEAMVFGLSIVFLYTIIGVVVAVLKNPNAVNNVTTNWITNLIFFLVFVILSASFFGMFEIMLPSGMANRLDQQADKGGYTGAFFMALAMSVLSFSCTGPIVGSLLIKASQGQVLEPVIGMAGFSISFALPFTLFAIFPSWLKSLPKSGGWLNAVKVFFAFIMLAFSLYFVAKIDQSYHLRIIDRELFLSIWIVIFTLLGVYLLGKIRFAHDTPTEYVGVPRFFLSIISFSLALYLLTSFLGNPLKPFASILPPADHETTTSQQQPIATQSLCSVPLYSDFLSLPHNLSGYFDYEEALSCAREQNKPVLVDFVGHTCSNCKKMYAEVWSDPRVLKMLREKFIIVALYTDDKTNIPDSAQYVSTVDGKIKNTMGKKNQDLQIARFQSNTLPLYVVVDQQGNTLSPTYFSYNPDVDQFIFWLGASINK